MRKTEILVASLLLAACSPQQPVGLPGYIEADYTRVAAPLAGRLVSLAVDKGQDVVAGAPLFVLDQEQEVAAVAEADARLRRQDATAADLAKGKRREEISVLEAQERQIAAQLALSEADLKRQRELAARGFLSTAGLDNAQTRVKADAAKLAEVRASLQVARLGARADTREAAQADVAAARAVLVQSEWRRDQKAVRAPAAARVDDTLYRVGEWVPAGSPVVSLLTPGALKIRFFVAQGELTKYAVGSRVIATCDGCATPFAARVSYVAKSPEFTPPVIYSQENRARLVFLVEAQPEQPQAMSPGQPVDVRLETGT